MRSSAERCPGQPTNADHRAERTCPIGLAPSVALGLSGTGMGRKTIERDGSDEGNPGGAGEGSQATGHPQNAG